MGAPLLDNSTAERIAAAIQATKFGEVILLIHDGEVSRIDTRIRAVAWSKKHLVDKHTRTANTVD